MALAEAATRRGRATRERLLEAAASLIAARGFHAVGIADIGAAAGVTGSAIYRHFRSKHDILVALFVRVVGDLIEGAQAARTVDALVAAHVDFALRERAIIAVYDQEVHNLPVDDRRRVRRQQRQYGERWVEVIAPLRPDLTEEAVRTTVHAVFGLINSVADFNSRLPEAELRQVLSSMALSVLIH